MLILFIFSLLSPLTMYFVSGFSSNLLSISHLISALDCVISFAKDFVFLWGQSLGRMIGVGLSESHGLYHLCTSIHVGAWWIPLVSSMLKWFTLA